MVDILVKSACVGDLSCDINQDKDSNPNSKSSVSVAAESRVLRRRCRLTNKRVISSASNSEETDSSSSSSSTRETQSEAKILKTRASNVLYSKTINKGMETSQIRKKVGRTSNKETRVADNIKTKHEDDNVSACSPKGT